VNDPVKVLFGKEPLEQGRVPHIPNDSPIWADSKGIVDKVCADKPGTSGP